jgi:predicted metalloendopeptidase
MYCWAAGCRDSGAIFSGNTSNLTVRWNAFAHPAESPNSKGVYMAARRIFAVLIVSFAILAALFLAPGSIRLMAADDSPAHGFDVADLDRSCKPCDDFYQFAVGGWLKANPIPPEYPLWGSFITLAEKNLQALHEILEAAATNTSAAPGSNEQKVGDFYATCMDTKAIDAQGLQPISAELASIDAIHDTAGLLNTGARLQTQGVGVLFAFGSDQDFQDSSKVIGEANQGGLGLPDRDYYTRDDDESKKLREQYLQHIAKLFTLTGETPEKADADAKTILGIETSLAKASMTNVERRDPQKVYHKMRVTDAQSLTPHLSWDAYFQAVGGPKLAEINIGQPDFFKALDGLLASVSLADWKTYYRWHLLDRSAALLSDPFVQENFAFNGRILTGSKEIRPRWKRCTSAVDQQIGEALGQVYVQKHFPPEAKARALDLVHNLLAALRDDLQTLPWMSPATRKAAIEKLEAFTIKIGYPDKWRDYSALKIDRSSYVSNTFRATQFENARDLAKIGKPVDRGEWGMTPPTVDAYNNGQLNEIVFPAGILQLPFYDPKRDDAYNYGGIGAVIGHEITHGFDDQGSQFDPRGNLKNWWTPDDLKSFQDRGECVAKQFDGYEVEKGLHENGKLVEGESIADLGGATLAYAAFQKSQHGKPGEKDANGFTPEQRFFLGYAENWAVNVRPELARLQTNTDPHPLPKFRANGPLSNMAEFAKAFGCKKGDAMVRAQVCKIW